MVNISSSVKQFAATTRNERQVLLTLSKDETRGFLNRIKVESADDENKRMLYSYASNKGLDMMYFKDKLNDMCDQIKEGSKLFREIMEWGLKKPNK